MIPILFSGDEVHFTSNGLGRLTDAISCIVTEERNGIFELEMEYPITGIHFEDIQIGTIIYATHDASKEPQPFDVYKRSAEIDGVVTFSAHHISYRLNTIVCMPFSLTNASASSTFMAIKNHAASTVPFFFYTDKTNTANYTLDKPNTIRQMLGGEENSILDVYGTGEYKFNKWNVTLYVNRGTDRGVNVRYGKNMTALQEERSVEGRYSAAVPFWLSEETGEMVTLPEIAVAASSLPVEDAIWTTEDDIIMRTNGGTEIEFNYPIVEYVPMDLSDQWEEAPTVAQLRARAQNRLENSQAWLTDENLSVDFTIGGMPEALNHVLLCDTVGVYFPAMGVEVKKKVIRTEYNALLDCYTNIELGNPKTTLFSAIEERTGDILTSYAKRSYMAAAIENATNLITGGTGGHVVFGFNADGQPEEIMIMDTPSTATAVNVIRINKNGIGFSTTGYDGAYTTAWTIDGSFVADFITSGTLNADLITAGTIRSQAGNSTWNLDTGWISTADNTRATLIGSGIIRFIKSPDGTLVNATETGSIRPVAWDDNYDDMEGVAYLAQSKYLALGTRWWSSNDQTYYMTAELVVNNGLNPNNYTEKLIAMHSMRIVGNTTIGGSLTTSSYLSVANYAQIYGNLTVGGTATITSSLSVGGSASTTGDLLVGGNLTATGTTFTFASVTVLKETYTGDFKAIKIKNGGLIVGDVAKFSGFDNRFSGSTYFDATVSGQTVTQRSDERLKNIEEYRNEYDAVLDELEPICFKWKNTDDGLHVGLGARKTAGILDKHGLEDAALVLRDDEAGYSINYSELTVMLLKRVQEQEKRIADLERRLSECR